MAVILVVDDEKANRALLRALLAPAHAVLEASDGAAALELAAQHPLDLVLLDVVMPGLDGFEVTRRLRLRERSDGCFLPVVLVTALTDQSSRRLGLAAGADEFLTKPIDAQELALRVRNLLSLREKSIEVSARNTELAELHRFKDEMTALLVHDLKNPLGALMANLDFIAAGAHEDAEMSEAVSDSRACARRLKELIANLIDTQRLEAARLEPDRRAVDPAGWLGPITSSRRVHGATRGVVVEARLEPGCVLDIDQALMTRVIENLLDNAMRYTPSGGRIVLEVAKQGPEVEVVVANTGRGIPESQRERIFEKYGQGELGTGRMNLGLGLYFCRLAVEAQGGRITLEGTPDLPVRFVIRLPAVTAPVDATTPPLRPP